MRDSGFSRPHAAQVCEKSETQAIAEPNLGQERKTGYSAKGHGSSSNHSVGSCQLSFIFRSEWNVPGLGQAVTEALNNKLSFTKRAWLSQHFLQKGLQWLLKYFKITEAQYQSPLIPLINFNNATMLKQNGTISTTSKIQKSCWEKPDKCYQRGPQRLPSSSSHLPFHSDFFSPLDSSWRKEGECWNRKFQYPDSRHISLLQTRLKSKAFLESWC